MHLQVWSGLHVILHKRFVTPTAVRFRRLARPSIGLAVVVAAMVMLTGLAGCQAYTDGGDRRTPGEVTDDVGISGNVKAKLVKDPEVKGFKINVDVRKRVVYLFGRVATQAQRERALALARSVKGVVRVEDRLALVDE